MDLFFWPSCNIFWLTAMSLIMFNRAGHARMLEHLDVSCFRILGTLDEREAIQGLSAIKLGQNGIAHQHTQFQSQILLECCGTEEFVPFAGPPPSLGHLDEKRAPWESCKAGSEQTSVPFISIQGIQPAGTILLWSHAGPRHSPCLWWPDMASLKSDAHLAFIFHSLH